MGKKKNKQVCPLYLQVICLLLFRFYALGAGTVSVSLKMKKVCQSHFLRKKLGSDSVFSSHATPESEAF